MAVQSCRGGRRSPSETVTITDTVTAVTPKSILLKQCARPSWSKHEQEFIAKSLIVKCDIELDDIEAGDEITIEIPLWLAREKGLGE